MDQKRGSGKKKIVSAAAMLMVSVIVLASASYAWFTMSREARVSNLELTASAPDNIQISIGSGIAKDGDVDVVVPTDADWYVGEIDLADTTVSQKYNVGKLLPASSLDGVKLYDIGDQTILDSTGAIKAGVTLKFTQLDAKDNQAKKYKTGSTPDAPTLKGYEGYFVDVPVWFKAPQAADATEPIKVYLNGIKIEDALPDDGKDISPSVRIAVLDTTKATLQGKIAAPATATNTQVASGAGALSNADYVKATSTYSIAPQEILTLNTDNDYQGNVVLRIWLEGQDSSANPQNIGLGVKLGVNFSLSDVADAAPFDHTAGAAPTPTPTP